MTGGEFWIGAFFGLIGALLGTKIDISMFKGIDLLFASLISSLGVGFPTEMASQSAHEDYNAYKNSQPSNSDYGGSTASGSVALSGGGGNSVKLYYALCP